MNTTENNYYHHCAYPDGKCHCADQATVDTEKPTNMKYKALVVAIQNKKGEFWQVALTSEEQDAVADFIDAMHGGRIKILDNKLDMHFKQKNL